MEKVIDIQFHLPDEPNTVFTGRMYLPNDRKCYFEFTDRNLGSQFTPPKSVYAIDNASGTKYTFINCYFKSYDFKAFMYGINELYQGCFLNKVVDNDCIEVKVSMTSLTDWLNNPRVMPEFSFSATEDSKVIIKPAFSVSFPINSNTHLELIEFCNEKYSRWETVLKNKTALKFVCNPSGSRLELYKNTIAFQRLLSLFTDAFPGTIEFELLFNDGREAKMMGQRNSYVQDEVEALMRYDELSDQFPKMLTIFYGSRDKFNKVLSLYNSSVKNNTAEISFLNTTTAFEVFHKYFLEGNNDDLRKRLISDLREKGVIKDKPSRWIQIVRYYHLFEVVKSIDFFKTNFPNPLKAITLLTNSRNYYTHYSESEDEIWTPNKLIYVNRLLWALLKAVVLIQLEMPVSAINKLLNNRAAMFYHDYENNDYSINYIDPNN
jgi:hypothetical protein